MNKLFTLLMIGALAILATLGGCASALKVDRSHAAVAQDSRVRYLILHYTYIDSAQSLKVLTQQQVSAHYLLDDGPDFKIYALVDEGRRAYHAGVSSWKGNTALNASSIGIEIVSLGWRDKDTGNGLQRVWFDFPQGQIDRLIPLVKDIVQRHGITPDRVLAHSDIAPQRKQDPGPRFPWKQLAAAGLVVWPNEQNVAQRQMVYQRQLPSIRWFQQKLAEHGFEIAVTGELDAATRNVVSVFQMKYRPAQFDGNPDAHTAALLDVLTASTVKLQGQ